MGLQVPKCCWWIQIEVPSAQKRSIILLYNHLKVLTAITVNHPFSMPLGSLGAKPQRQPTLSFRLEYLPVPTTSGKTLFQLQKCYAQRKARQHAIKYHKPAKVKRQRSLGTGGSSTMNSFASNAISIGKEEKAAREAFNDAADKALCAGKQAPQPPLTSALTTPPAASSRLPWASTTPLSSSLSTTLADANHAVNHAAYHQLATPLLQDTESCALCLVPRISF